MPSVTSAGTCAVPADSRSVPPPGHALRFDIQGLRAVAVVLVVLSHAGVSQISGGYIGVDVFFVMSGFLITSLLLRELATTGRVSVRSFYARRALRLLPVSSLVIAVTLGGAWLFLSKVRLAEYAGDALASALYAVNFRLAAAGTDYLAQNSPPSPFQHFWSLAVEEQFYLVWPLLLLLTWRVARGRRRLVAVPLGVLCLGSFVAGVLVTGSSAPWAYFGSLTRAWELGAGALLALGAGRLERLPAALAAPLTWLGLACVTLAAVGYDEETPFPGWYALVPVAGTVLVLAGGCTPAPRGAGWLLGRRPLVWLGGLSYGWYLWHWPLLVIGPVALGRADGTAGVPLALGLSVAALGLAWLTLRLVENPVRFHRAFRRRPRRALVLGAALSVGASALSLTATAVPPTIEVGGPAPALAQVLSGAPAPRARLTELLASSPTALPSNLTPSLPQVKSSRSAVYRDGCHVGYTATGTRPCVYGDRTSSRTVVLFGDSHAAQWFPALQRIATARRWKLVSMTKASCKVADVTIGSGHKPYTACDTWRSNAMARIRTLRPDLVVVSSSDAGEPARPAADPLRQWTTGFENTFRDLGTSGVRVAALLDTPWPKGDPVDCAARNSLQLRACANHLPDATRDASRGTALRTAASATATTVIDPTAWLCAPRTGICPVVVADTAVYRDESHLSEAYAAALAPVLAPPLDRLMGTP
ncbi:acyltransferase family protein [Streptomyces shenzhenensis]|uniref:Acyltransferase n=1 Tax=Streptomyces shenzhenensis TaxID=943815 RepID=A0A3M0I066_9ACTN|nr:acyltransferase family protein [Streptomyces shenzhenensis]RMB80083.1 acyltransferase [Streptomyces shenzhenensis]